MSSEVFTFKVEAKTLPHGILVYSNSKYWSFIWTNWLRGLTPDRAIHEINSVFNDLMFRSIDEERIHNRLCTVLGKNLPRKIPGHAIANIINSIGSDPKSLALSYEKLKEEWSNLYDKAVKQNGLETQLGHEPMMKIFSAHFLLNREVYHFGGLNGRIDANKTMSYLKEFAIGKNVWISRDGFIKAMEKTVRKLTAEPIVQIPRVLNPDKIIR